jgi:hypothetical protein
VIIIDRRGGDTAELAMFIMPTDKIASDITTSIYVGVMEFNGACAKAGWKGNVSFFLFCFSIFFDTFGAGNR